ncbi:MAG: hypothetical protein KC618_03105, partial [Candidatus Omnitrophica bacterium]|nr:hypothetical protein [Candidatus Omnitrophota bacterium]
VSIVKVTGFMRFLKLSLIIFFFTVLFCGFYSSCLSAEENLPARTLVYNTYDSKTGEYISEYKMILGYFQDTKQDVTIDYEGIQEKYELDFRYETQRVKFTDKLTVTNYTGIRYGDQFVITGILNGETISRTLTIDGLPFYFNPKLGLMDFVIRNDQKREFWGIRNDTLSTYRMVAKKMGEEFVNINNSPVEAVKVYWAPVGMASMFFHRTYWFRKKDGVFLKAEGSNNRTRILVREK